LQELWRRTELEELVETEQHYKREHAGLLHEHF